MRNDSETVSRNPITKYISICHLNIRSIRNKVQDVDLLLHSLDFPEIVCLTETSCNYSEINLIKLHFYTLTDYHCRSQSSLGGVAIFVKNNIKFKIMTCDIKKVDFLFEYAFIEISLDNISALVGCFYRSPSYDCDYFISNIDDLLYKLLKPNSPTFICGDFNLNFDENIVCNKADKLSVVFSSYDLKKCINEYTRIDTNRKSKTVIDNIFSNIGIETLNPKVIHCDLSDHFLQIVYFPYVFNKTHASSYILKRFFNSDEKMNYFRYLLSLETWSFLYSPDVNSDDKFTKFHLKFIEIFDIAFPLEMYRVKENLKPKKPWLTQDLINEGIFVRDVYKSYKFTGDEEVHIRYNILKKNHQNKINAAKRLYNESLIINSENKSKTAWQIIKNQNQNFKSKNLPQTFIGINGDPLSDVQSAAQAFNDFFINSIKQLTQSMSVERNSEVNVNNNSIFLSPVTADEMSAIIKSVSLKNSSGEDGIPCSILKGIIDYITIPLTHLVNLSFQEGTFPSSLKKALVVPIHKRSDKSILSNYRGIVLLSVFSKIYEKSYCIRLNIFLSKEKILVNNQFGFRSGCSTQDAILSLYNFILSSFEKKDKCACVFFDLTRAFETVDHSLLIDKLQNYGIRGPALDWIRTYLLDRYQKVSLNVNNRVYNSGLNCVPTGVPQGSVLGPLLFILFINDIFSHMKGTFLSIFADDTATADSSKDLHTLAYKVNNTVSLMRKYCTCNGLDLNVHKTNFLTFSIKPLDSSLLIKMTNKSIAQQDTVKYLGLQIDSCLSWGNQIDLLLKKLSTHCFVLWQMRQHVSIHILKIYYYAYVQSCLDYCIICWGSCSRMGELLVMQKKIIRTMTFKSSRDSCKTLFSELHILTVPSLYILRCVLYVKSHIDTYIPRDGHSTHYLRENFNITVPQHRLTTVAKGPNIMSIKLYNKLPLEVKKLNNINSFKHVVRSILTYKSFYSVSEYMDCNDLSSHDVS